MLEVNMETSWNDLLKEAGNGVQLDPAKTIDILVFCEKPSTLKQFFKYIDEAYINSNCSLQDSTPIVSPIGYYTKEISSDEGWQLTINITCSDALWNRESLQFLPEVLQPGIGNSKVFINSGIMLLDWLNEDQAYWLEDIAALSSCLKEVYRDLHSEISVLMIHSDYCKHLEKSHTKWSSNIVDFMHQSLRVLAFKSDQNLLSDLKNPELAVRYAIEGKLREQEKNDLVDFANLDNVNVFSGTDSLNKISMIDDRFELSKYTESTDLLMKEYKNTIPTTATRAPKKISQIAERDIDSLNPHALLPNVQEQLAKLHQLQRKGFHLSLIHI